MAVSNFINDNEEYIKSAINNGISSGAINLTLEKIASYDKPPKQVALVIKSIVDMKGGNSKQADAKYLSELVSNNEEKIKNALINGISKEEIATALLKKLDDKENKSNLNFIVRLICGMKRQEIRLQKSGVQKQLIME